MSLVFAAITPHPPLLIPTIGRQIMSKLAKTKAAFGHLEEELYLAKPNVIVVISPHGLLLPDAFTLNLSADYQTDLRPFGDLATRLTFKGEFDLPHAIREATKKRPELPTVLITEKLLDHGVTVPLCFLTSHLAGISILPLGYSQLDLKIHFDFGTLLKDQIMNTNKRVAVIASADLSHALSTEAPAGYHAAGVRFDAKVQELLSAHNSTGLIQLNSAMIAEAAECGLRSIVMLLGILHHINYTYEALSYEAPFGVGYLTAQFAL